MKIITTIDEMQFASDELHRQGLIIGLVPTMGYLHNGHLSLIKLAKQHSDIVITTIFVNPTQFGPNEDFSRYPRDIERDKKLAEEAGTHILFVPQNNTIYPEGYSTYVAVENLSNVLEGKFRPGHFRGMATIVLKLFNITKPNIAVFGQKDAQQVAVIKKMVKDLNCNINIIVSPITREQDGLAMSSRNMYLSISERKESIVLYQSLLYAKQLIEKGERNCITIISEMTKLILSKPSARIDYISIANAETLEEYTTLSKCDNVLISLATHIGTTRLIDNILLTI